LHVRSPFGKIEEQPNGEKRGKCPTEKGPGGDYHLLLRLTEGRGKGRWQKKKKDGETGTLQEKEPALSRQVSKTIKQKAFREKSKKKYDKIEIFKVVV